MGERFSDWVNVTFLGEDSVAVWWVWLPVGPGRARTHTEPALVRVHGEGGDEAQAQVVPQRPGVAAAAQVPAHQGAVDGGVRQHRLRARVEVVDVHRTALLLQVQEPERGTDAW